MPIGYKTKNFCLATEVFFKEMWYKGIYCLMIFKKPPSLERTI
ncbi:MAG: hypothetical protein JWM14_1782 [Chitinophagaceae bacterium]|nr:hypothetical protein [Chitinophagaceae bacterium]